MDLSGCNDGGAMTIGCSESELQRLTQSERDVEARLASARGVLRQATSAQQALLGDAANILDAWATRAAEDRVRSAEGVVRKLEHALAVVRQERVGVQNRLEAARDRARRLDESAVVALVMCEIVDALKAFERAADRLAAALEASHGKAAHTAPVVASSLRIGRTSFAAETRAVVSEIEAYRAGLVDGSIKSGDAIHLGDNSAGRALMRAHELAAAAPTVSIAPSPVPATPTLISGAQREVA